MLANARGLRAENPKSSRLGSISSATSEMGVKSGEGRWGGGADEVAVVVGGVAFTNAKREKGLRAEMAKSEMGVEGGGGRRFGRANEVVVVEGRYIGKREAGEGAEGQNGEIEPLGLDFEGAIGNGGGGQWVEAVRLRK
jgi:hypothetical protein